MNPDPIKDYVETLLDFWDAKVDFEKAQNHLKILEQKVGDAYSKFEVISDDDNDQSNHEQV